MARVNEGSHSFTCPLHTFIHKWNEPYLTPQPQGITALWLVLISRPAEDRRLSWPGRYPGYLPGYPGRYPRRYLPHMYPPHVRHVGEILLFNKFLQLSVHALVAKPGIVVRWCADGEFLPNFCVLYFQRAANFRPAF